MQSHTVLCYLIDCNRRGSGVSSQMIRHVVSLDLELTDVEINKANMHEHANNECRLRETLCRVNERRKWSLKLCCSNEDMSVTTCKSYETGHTRISYVPIRVAVTVGVIVPVRSKRCTEFPVNSNAPNRRELVRIPSKAHCDAT